MKQTNECATATCIYVPVSPVFNNSFYLLLSNSVNSKVKLESQIKPSYTNDVHSSGNQSIGMGSYGQNVPYLSKSPEYMHGAIPSSEK